MGSKLVTLDIDIDAEDAFNALTDSAKEEVVKRSYSKDEIKNLFSIEEVGDMSEGDLLDTVLSQNSLKGFLNALIDKYGQSEVVLALGLEITE